MSKAEQTREYIISQTAPVFNRKGFAGTSMSDLMKATGLSKGAIYGRFKSKEEVALEAFDYNMKQITNTIGEMMSLQVSSLDKLWVFPKFYREAFKRKFLKLGCPIVNSAPEADDMNERLRDHVNGAIAHWDEGIRNLVKEGKTNKEIKPVVEPQEVAAIMITQIEGGIMIAKSMGDIKYLNIALDQVEKMLTEISL